MVEKELLSAGSRQGPPMDEDAPPDETDGIGAALIHAERWLSLAAIFFALFVLGSWLLIAFARVDDTYGTVGPWTGLASYTAHGTLYPPLFDGESFGGTRYMPLQFLLYAGMSKVTGEFFVSAKMVVAIVAVALLALVYFGLRSIGCRRSEALALTGVVIAAGPVLLASLDIAGDSVAVVMQLAAVIIIVRRHNHRAVTLAGGLCGLAFLAKLSAIWAPVAIVDLAVQRCASNASDLLRVVRGNGRIRHSRRLSRE